jgi:hypothetical protein
LFGRVFENKMIDALFGIPAPPVPAQNVDRTRTMTSRPDRKIESSRSDVAVGSKSLHLYAEMMVSMSAVKLEPQRLHEKFMESLILAQD